MLFNSSEFIFAFLPTTLFIYYYLIRKRLITAAQFFLIIASLFFYGYWTPDYIWLIIGSICFNFTMGSSISYVQKQQLKYPQKHYISPYILLLIGIFFNIFLLGYFKYTDFLISSINTLLQQNFNLRHILLPLAISFFTFQQIAYLVDSYKGYTKEYDFLSYTLFIVFFPQLIAGPIVHHKELIPQFYNKRNMIINYENISRGLYIFLIGLFKKVIIADSFAYWVNQAYTTTAELNIFEAWATSLSYTFQLYFDFSGYCDMSIGIALLFNIKLPINFNSPYKALNIQEFWRRWHITLSKFLRDYIYIPLGGNQRGERRQLLNLFMVFFIGGLWHGASYMFIIWGCLHGFAIVLHRIWQKTGRRIHKYIAWFLTFNFVNIAWIFFRAPDISAAKKILFGMVNIDSLNTIEKFKIKQVLQHIDGRTNTLTYLLAAILIILLSKNSVEMMKKYRLTPDNYVRISVFWGTLFVFTVIRSLTTTYSEFIYFNF